MNMKKLASLLLCVVIAVVSLVGCETAIGQYYKDVYEPNGIGNPVVKSELKFDFYIITEFPGENATEAEIAQHNSDLATIKDNINLHLKDEYSTELNIIFKSADEYEETIKNATSGIVLINSESLMNELMQNNKLADLTNYLESSEYEFGTLNVQIASTLLEAAKIDVEGTKKLYCIPNNHVVGSYNYIAINNAIAAKLQYGKNDIANIDTIEEAEAFINVARDYWDTLPVEAEFNPAYVLQYFDGFSYGYEGADAPRSAWTYNVRTLPEVTKAEAYSTAYGILSETENPERAMEIIYALNTDVQFRNLLQYGVLNNDYEFDNSKESDAIYVKVKNTMYKMNILYTGDVFMAYYNENWTEEMALAGKMQNSESVLSD